MNKIILKLRDKKQYKLMPIKKTCLKKNKKTVPNNTNKKTCLKKQKK